MTLVLICKCGHPKTRHKRQREGCRNCDEGCARFEVDMSASRVAQDAEAATGGKALYAAAGAGTDGQPTSARLREVEAELYETQKLVDQKQQQLCEAEDRATGLRAELEKAVEGHRIMWGRERDASVKLRRERDQAREQLDAARSRIAGLERSLAAQLARDELTPADGLIFGQNARHCAPCGWTGRDELHPHPTIPVRVTVTRRLP